MSEIPRRWRLPAGLAAVGTLLVVVAVLIGTSSGDPDPAPVPSADVSPQGALGVRVSDRPGRRIPLGFLGFSFEFQAVRAYTGPAATHINPVLVALVRNLSPGQAPEIRIGGDSTDLSWVPARGVKPPPYRNYRLTRGWLATTGALARELGARMTMGLNLAADQPALDRAEARAFLRVLGPGRLAAFEIGNEPNVYAKIALLKTKRGRPLKARPHGLSYTEFRHQFAAAAATTRGVALAGPALAAGPTPNRGSWVQPMPNFLAHEPRLRYFTIHRYPLRNCYVPQRSVQYPTVPHLLSSYATVSLARGIRRWVAIADHERKRLRIDELNSVACRGKAGISDTFASALWVTDALFTLAHAGVDGVNLHTLPKSAYELFHFTHAAGRWSAYVQPVYYGLQLFARATPPGARLLTVHKPPRTSGLSIWATRAPDGTLRVVLINKAADASRSIRLQMPAGTGAPATVQRLQAPSEYARGGVTLGGRTYGAQTTSGVLATPHLQSLTVEHGAYTLSVPAGSAALVTFDG